MSDINSNQDLDLSLLNEIADGSDEFIIESIAMFLQQTTESLEAISDGIGSRDWVTTGSAVHKLKPTLGFFGMLDTQALMQDIESSCKDGVQNPDDIAAKFSQAKANLNINIPALIKIKAEAEARL
jgi:HPt (histidine-containing phosphotransfer) domain-containing protein